MKNKYARRLVHILMTAMLLISVFHLSSPFFSSAKNRTTLVIVGNTEDESPISGVEIEVYRSAEEGKLGESVGKYTSKSDSSGDGQIYLELENGDYNYKILSESYELPEKQSWQSFRIEEGQEVILLWISPKADGKEELIVEEETPKGAPSAANETKPEGNFEEGGKGDHQNMKMRELQFENSKNVLITLGILAMIIFGIIGIDFLVNSRK